MRETKNCRLGNEIAAAIIVDLFHCYIHNGRRILVGLTSGPLWFLHRRFMGRRAYIKRDADPMERHPGHFLYNKLSLNGTCTLTLVSHHGRGQPCALSRCRIYQIWSNSSLLRKGKLETPL